MPIQEVNETSKPESNSGTVHRSNKSSKSSGSKKNRQRESSETRPIIIKASSEDSSKFIGENHRNFKNGSSVKCYLPVTHVLITCSGHYSSTFVLECIFGRLFLESGRAQNSKMAASEDNLKKAEYGLFRMSSRMSRNKKIQFVEWSNVNF